eukprot:Clim_evm27s33 gene=Clim_evmTU27s33
MDAKSLFDSANALTLSILESLPHTPQRKKPHGHTTGFERPSSQAANALQKQNSTRGAKGKETNGTLIPEADRHHEFTLCFMEDDIIYDDWPHMWWDATPKYDIIYDLEIIYKKRPKENSQMLGRGRFRVRHAWRTFLKVYEKVLLEDTVGIHLFPGGAPARTAASRTTPTQHKQRRAYIVSFLNYVCRQQPHLLRVKALQKFLSLKANLEAIYEDWQVNEMENLTEQYEEATLRAASVGAHSPDFLPTFVKMEMADFDIGPPSIPTSSNGPTPRQIVVTSDGDLVAPSEEWDIHEAVSANATGGPTGSNPETETVWRSDLSTVGSRTVVSGDDGGTLAAPSGRSIFCDPTPGSGASTVVAGSHDDDALPRATSGPIRQRPVSPVDQGPRLSLQQSPLFGSVMASAAANPSPEFALGSSERLARMDQAFRSKVLAQQLHSLYLERPPLPPGHQRSWTVAQSIDFGGETYPATLGHLKDEDLQRLLTRLLENLLDLPEGGAQSEMSIPMDSWDWEMRSRPKYLKSLWSTVQDAYNARLCEEEQA